MVKICEPGDLPIWEKSTREGLLFLRDDGKVPNHTMIGDFCVFMMIKLYEGDLAYDPVKTSETW